MKTARHLCLLALATTALLLPRTVLAQAFSSGSTGTDGVLDVLPAPQQQQPVVLPKRASGIFNYTTIRVRQGATLKFERNDANTPIHLLATDNVLIEGTVDVSGSIGGPLNGGEGGPGGFDGGKPGIAGKAPGAGYGPGGGKGGAANAAAEGAGGGSYATQATATVSTNKGPTYGTELLLPLLGGSGGGGQPGFGGAGGGGAILIASSKRIDVTGTARILANGGLGGATWGYGSGGAIRLVAETVAGTNGTLSAVGGGFGGDGRIRVDLVRREGLALHFTPNAPGTLVVGSLLAVFPPVTPQIDITAVGQERIPPNTRTRVFVNLPPGTPETQQVELEVRDFNQMLPVTVAVIPDSGLPSYYNDTVDNVASNPGRKKVTVTIPANVLVRVMAWSR